MEGKNKLMMIIIIVLLVVLIGAVVGLTFFSIQNMNKNPAQDPERTVVEQVVRLTQNEIEDIDFSSAITTNLQKGSDGLDHQIRILLSIGVNKKEKTSAEMITFLSGKEKIMRAMALEIIRLKTLQEMERPDGEEILKSEILVKLQEEFNTNLIVSVNIVDIILN